MKELCYNYDMRHSTDQAVVGQIQWRYNNQRKMDLKKQQFDTI
jgi:hypothetical protein